MTDQTTTQIGCPDKPNYNALAEHDTFGAFLFTAVALLLLGFPMTVMVIMLRELIRDIWRS